MVNKTMAEAERLIDEDQNSPCDLSTLLESVGSYMNADRNEWNKKVTSSTRQRKGGCWKHPN